MILYEDELKVAFFGGLKYTRDDRTGYYLNSTRRKRLHRAVWESENGDIPNGMQVHHKDGDRSNNEISNLELLSSEAHHSHHGDVLTQEERQWRRDNLKQTARPAAAEWHRSSEGRSWHKEHYAQTAVNLHKKQDYTCIQCGVTYASRLAGSKFCSNKCKSAWRRANGVDDVVRKCEYCGGEFIANKYNKQRYCSKRCSNSAEPRLPTLRKGSDC